MISKHQSIKILTSVLVVAALATQSVFAAVGGRPANPDPDNPRTQSIFIYTLNGGESKSDQIYLSNNNDQAETVELFAVDGTVSNTGAYTCKQNIEAHEDVGAWLKLGKSEVTVEAHGSALVDFSLEVPKNADVGEHAGCIAMQRKDDPGQRTGSIQLTNRTAVRVAVIVPGDIHRKVSIEDFAAKDAKSGPNITFGLKNEGNVSADVKVDVDLKDIFGNKVYHNGGQYVVVADTTFGVNYETEFRPFFGGWYKTKAFISYDKRAGTFGVNENGQLLHDESPEITLFVMPSIWFFILLGALLVLTVVYMVWRRKTGGRRKKKAVTEKVMWGLYTAKSGDTVEALAKAHGVSTNKVLVLNKLTSSTLKPGQKIYLPRRK